ncbi:MAG: hypothetical protein KA401_05035 [Anaerolineae bacterium]|nr:hypothetical protein [Chloroflexota bacterium]MBP6298689.1 hypothetical protein [Anaerolineae bacterium]
MSRLYRNRRSSTTFAALLLLLLVILAGQNTFTGFISRLFQARPSCSAMRQAVDRDKHQSLIARAAAQRGSPVRVEVSLGSYPVTAEGTLDVTLIFTNTTIGTVPFVYSGGIPINNPVPDGFGVVVGSQALPTVSAANGFLPDSNVRLLVPLQSCVEIIRFNVSQLQQFGIQPGSVVRAYYRNSNLGPVQSAGDSVYSDHGLWIGVAESRSQVVPIQATTQ